MSGIGNWSSEGANILAPDKLASVKHHLENVGFIMVLWSHYFGSRAPTRLTFDSYDDFLRFVETEPRKGDAIDIWAFPTDPEARIAYGKIPNEKGEVPERGAY